MKVLLTGHDGFIGSILRSRLVDAGHDVVDLDSLYFHPDTGGSRSRPRDIRDVARADLQGVEAVIHLAALSNDPLGDLDPELTYDINHAASVRLAELSREAGVSRFLYSSSCSMYGVSGDDFVTEDAPLSPITPYAISKARVEEDVSRLGDKDFSPVFLRNATAYGMSPRLRTDLVLNDLVCWAYTTGKIRILSDGTPWRPVVHAEDISRAFEAMLDAPHDVVHNQAFNVGRTSENYRVRDLAEIVRGTVAGCVVEYAGTASPDQRSYRVDFSKIADLVPRFQPEWTAQTGAREVYDGVRNAGVTSESFQGREYVRLEQLKRLIALGKLDDSLRWTTDSVLAVAG